MTSHSPYLKLSLYINSSLSSLLALQDSYSSNPIIQRTHILLDSLSSFSSAITSLWIPGHINLPEHDGVDFAAKQSMILPLPCFRSQILPPFPYPLLLARILVFLVSYSQPYLYISLERTTCNSFYLSYLQNSIIYLNEYVRHRIFYQFSKTQVRSGPALDIFSFRPQWTWSFE